MKRFNKIIAMFIAMVSLLLANPVNANAEWRQSGNGWWYAQGGNSYAIGWKQIDGEWYYFDENGYMKTGWLYDAGNWYYFYGEGNMAHDCYIGSYYLGSNGAWTTSVPTVTSSSNTSESYNNYGTSVSNNKTETVYIASSGKGKKYHSNPNCSNMNGTISLTLGEAQSRGYTACKKCY